MDKINDFYFFYINTKHIIADMLTLNIIHIWHTDNCYKIQEKTENVLNYSFKLLRLLTTS